MTTPSVLSERDGPVGRVIFHNPARRNALSLTMWEATAGIVEDLAADPEIRVIVLSGSGELAFAAGADISRFQEERHGVAAVEHYNRITERAFASLQQAGKPTIAMIHGYCIGGGLALAISCDLRFCAPDARFAIPAAKLGLGYGYAGVRRLVQLVGPAFAQEIFFTARQFDAEQARLMGLVNRVVEKDNLAATVADTAATIAANAPLTVAAVKQTVMEILKDPEERELHRCEAAIRACFDSEDYLEGRQAFLEKRPPVFQGR